MGNIIMKDSSEIYKYYIQDQSKVTRLEKLHEQKYRLKEYIKSVKDKEPFVVELAGMPRTGKTVSTERVFEFFNIADFKVVRTKEPAQIVKERYGSAQLSGVEFNDKTLEISREQLDECKSKKPDIILQDRGVFDNYIWYQMMYERGQISLETYMSKISNIDEVLHENDQLYLMTAEPSVIIKRDYADQIFLEPRKKTTIEGVTQLKNGMEHLLSKVSDDGIILLDTTDIDAIDTAVEISSGIINGMSKKLGLILTE